MKTTLLYVQFLLINVVKFNVFLNTAQNAIHHVQELFFFWTKRYTAIQPRRCSCIILSNAAEVMVKHQIYSNILCSSVDER